MADVAFDAVKLVVNFIREEARLQGRAGDDVRFIMDEMESMNNLLHQLVSMTKPINHDTAGGGGGYYSHLRTWMKQLLELAFDSRNSVELYIQSGDSHCCRLPWAVVARHRVVSQIRELKERAREISDRQMRYGGGLLPAQRQDGNAGDAGGHSAVSNSIQRHRRAHAGSSSADRRAILHREFVDNSSVDEALRRLNVLINSDDEDSSGDESSDNDNDPDGEPPVQSDVSDKQQKQPTLPDTRGKQQQSDAGDKQQSNAGDKQQPTQSDTGDKKQQSDAGVKQQQSDGSDKQPQQQPTPSDTGNKKQQWDASDKEQQQQPTQSDTGDKKQQSDAGVKQQQSDGSDKQPQQQPTPSDTGNKKQQSDAGVKPQQQPMLLDTVDKQQQSDAGDKKQQSDTGVKPQQSMLLDTGDKQQQSGAGDKQQEPTLSDTGDKRQQSDAGDLEEQRSDVGDKQLDGSDKKKKKKKKKEEEEEEEEEEGGIRVVTILVQDGMDEAAVGEAVLKRYRAMSRKYRLVLHLHVSVRRPPVLSEIKVHIANQAKKQQSHMERYPYSRNSQAFPAAGDNDEFKEEKKAEEFIKNYSSNDRLLLVLSGLSCPKILKDLKSFLCGLSKGGSSHKFAIALCTNDRVAAKDCSYPATDDKSLIEYSLVDIYLERAVALLPGRYDDDMPQTVRGILEECRPDEVCMKMILHALYYNPDMTKKEMERLKDSLQVHGTGHQEKENRIITFCYQTLPNDYKNCLWYSAVFTRGISTPGRGVRRASLLRRWIAQELIKEEDEANHCFDAMVEQKLINSHEVSGMGKVKSCAVHTLVDDLIKRESPTVEDLLLNNQLPIENLELLVSIRNGMQLHPASSSITSFLNSMSSNSMSLLRVLDLEGRNDLKLKDLWTICKIRKLKYLSLRNTDVAHLPREIGQLEDLETLDIRGTKVLAFNTVLPKLKHLLAGRIIECQDSDIIKSKESFSTVCMPRAVDTMEKLEILSRVKVTDSAKELTNVGDKLEHLKKLGVVLSGKKASLKELFLQIEKLNQCLRSLSIRMEPPGSWDAADVILLRPPKLLESLHICSIRRGLPPRIKELHHLLKITLRDTFLKQDDLCVLGMLPKLRYLRLFYHSFGEGTITFGDSSRNWIFLSFEEDLSFKNLTDLAIEDDTITSVTLNILPKLQKMTWSFSYMESLSGVQDIRSLTHLVLNGGSYNEEGLQTLQRDIDRNRNRNGIDSKPPQRGEESRVVGPAP